MKETDAARYEILYDLPEGEYHPAAVGGIRTRTLRAGDVIEVACFPVTRVGDVARAECLRRKSTPAQARLNRQRAAQRVRLLIEGNFTGADYVLTLTWDYGAVDRDRMPYAEALSLWEAEGLPRDEDEARRAWGNYIKRVRYHMGRAGHAGQELKFLYVLESTREPRDEDPRPLYPRYHFHAVIHAPGLTREALKALWPFGFVRADELSTRDEGVARLAGYMTKQCGRAAAGDARKFRRWACSKNLKEPEERVSDRAVSRRRAMRVAEDVRQWGREIFEAVYPGYRCVEDPEVRYSDFVAGAYIRARLRKVDDRAPWERVRGVGREPRSGAEGED